VSEQSSRVKMSTGVKVPLAAKTSLSSPLSLISLAAADSAVYGIEWRKWIASTALWRWLEQEEVSK